MLNILRLCQKTGRKKVIVGYIFEKVERMVQYLLYNECLPFQLTGVRRNGCFERDYGNECRQWQTENRPFCGSVGRGKTLVALMSMLLALWYNGYQACMMATYRNPGKPALTKPH